jgi:L-ascorbate metabolism protein UlaG (beta-lactamase superfamily)
MSPFRQKIDGLRLERMRASRQYAEEGFVNTYTASTSRVGDEKPSLIDFMFRGKDLRVPSQPLPSLDPRAAWMRPVQSGVRATWLGHSTVLLEIDGRRVLTDPVWGARASPLPFIGPKRFQPVPVAIDALPPLDAIVISHDHYDHLDYPSVRALAALDVPFITSLGVGARLEAWGVPSGRIVELDWWESTRVAPGLLMTAAPSHHFSGRTMHDRNATLWSSFAIRGERSAVFFSGDTGLSPHFAEIGQRLGPFDLVMLEVGAFHPLWGDIHLGPENALRAWRQLGSGRLLPVHWATFNLAMHPWAEPAEVLYANAPEGLVMPLLGEAIEPAHVEGVQPWWRQVATAREATPAAPSSRVSA